MKVSAATLLAGAAIVLVAACLWYKPTASSLEESAPATAPLAAAMPPVTVVTPLTPTPAPSPVETDGLCTAGQGSALPLLTLRSWQHLHQTEARLLLVPAERLSCLKLPYEGPVRLVRYDGARRLAYDEIGQADVQMRLEQKAESFEKLLASASFFKSDLKFASDQAGKDFLRDEGVASGGPVAVLQVRLQGAARVRARADRYDSFPSVQILSGEALKAEIAKGGTAVFDLNQDPRVLRPLVKHAVSWDVGLLRTPSLLTPAALKPLSDKLVFKTSKNVTVILVGASAVDRAPYNAALWLASRGYSKIIIAREGLREWTEKPEDNAAVVKSERDLSLAEWQQLAQARVVDTRELSQRLQVRWKDSLWWPASKVSAAPAEALLKGRPLVFLSQNEDAGDAAAPVLLAAVAKGAQVYRFKGGFEKLRLLAEVDQLGAFSSQLEITAEPAVGAPPASMADQVRQRSNRAPEEIIQMMKGLQNK